MAGQWDRFGGQFPAIFPYDTANAGAKTAVRMLFDGDFLYVGAVCYQPRRYVITSLNRDFSHRQSDLFAVNLDPFRDKLNKP